MLKESINGYALALFLLAKEEKKLIKVKEDALEIIEALSENHDYLSLLSSKKIILEEKEKMINNAFKGIEKNLINFFSIIANKSQTSITLPVLNKLVSYINEELHIKEGVVYSVEKLTPLEIKKMEEKVNKKLGFMPILKNKIDTELISGFKIVVGDVVIEDSITSRLEQIRHELLREEN